jgi:hypothetical protein
VTYYTLFAFIFLLKRLICLSVSLIMLRCIGRDWHLTDKPPAPEFVAYWTNNGQKAVLGLDLSAAIDPERTLAVHCGNGLYGGLSPYRNARLSRYDAVSRAWGQTCSDASSSRFAAVRRRLGQLRRAHSKHSQR